MYFISTYTSYLCGSTVFLEAKQISLNMEYATLRKKCPYPELIWPAFGRNTVRYGVSLRIQSECGKMQTRITPNTDNFYEVQRRVFIKNVCTHPT